MSKVTLHHLVDELPESEVQTARRFLEYLRDSSDPLLRVLQEAEEDDEELSAEEEEALEEALEELQRGELLTQEQARRELAR